MNAALAVRPVWEWRVDLRDVETGRLLPLMVEAGPESAAISGALRKAARFCPGRRFRPVKARKTL